MSPRFFISELKVRECRELFFPVLDVADSSGKKYSRYGQTERVLRVPVHGHTLHLP